MSLHVANTALKHGVVCLLQIHTCTPLKPDQDSEVYTSQKYNLKHVDVNAKTKVRLDWKEGPLNQWGH